MFLRMVKQRTPPSVELMHQPRALTANFYIQRSVIINAQSTDVDSLIISLVLFSLSPPVSSHFTPCSAATVYIRFKYVFGSIEISLNLINSFGRCLVNPIIQYWRCLFYINIQGSPQKKNIWLFSQKS